MKRIIMSVLLALGMVAGIATPANAGWSGHTADFYGGKNGGDYNGRQVTVGITGLKTTYRLYVYTPGNKISTGWTDHSTVKVCMVSGQGGGGKVLVTAKRQNGNWGRKLSWVLPERKGQCESLWPERDISWVRWKLDAPRNGQGWRAFDEWAPPHREPR